MLGRTPSISAAFSGRFTQNYGSWVKQSARLRRKVEMLYAHLKRNLNFRRLRLRGMTGARDECILAATAQNLRKLVKLIGSSPPSLLGACA